MKDDEIRLEEMVERARFEVRLECEGQPDVWVGGWVGDRARPRTDDSKEAPRWWMHLDGGGEVSVSVDALRREPAGVDLGPEAVAILSVLAEVTEESGLGSVDAERVGYADLDRLDLAHDDPDATEIQDPCPLTATGCIEAARRWPVDPAEILAKPHPSVTRLRIALATALVKLTRVQDQP